MRRSANIFVGFVLTTGILLTVWAFLQAPPTAWQWWPFVIFTGAALLAEIQRTEGHRNISHSALAVLEFVGLLLLHPAQWIVMVSIPLLFDWARARLTNSSRLRQWYKQPFNISMTIIAGMASLAGTQFIRGGDPNPSVYASAMVLSIIGAAVLFVLANHLILRVVITLAQHLPLKEILALDPRVLFNDLMLLLLGYIVAILWALNPWLILLALSPLSLIYQALKIPELEHEAHTDGKTGLLNAQHFMEQATLELDRAVRQGQQGAVLMADLDFLRDINNSYGHLAGDTVLAGVGKVIGDTIRGGDLAGRFGGEEFAIVLTNVGGDEALHIAERLRKAVAAAEFMVTTSKAPIKATMSLGVACFPHDATALLELLHQADVAVYHAKTEGRNRVSTTIEVPHSFQLEGKSLLSERVPVAR